MVHKILPRAFRLAVLLAVLPALVPASLFAASGQGRVLDARERPVPQAVVFLLPVEGPPVRAIADREGVFRVPDLPGGTYDLAVRGEGFAPLAVRGIPVPPEGAVDLGTVLLQPGTELAGRVTGEDGEPVAGAAVRAEAGDPVAARLADLGEAPGATTGADGGFVIRGLRPGDTVALRVEHPDYAAGAVLPGVHLAGEEPVTVTVLRGSPPSGPKPTPKGGGARPPHRAGEGILAGRILGLSFEELQRVEVRANSAEEERAAVVDYTGAWRLERAAPGEWTVTARIGEREARGRVRLASGKGATAALDLTFPGILVLSGTIQQSGDPVAGVWVEARRLDGGPAVTGMTDPEGRFRFEGLQAGEYEVSVERPGGRKPHRRTFELAGDRDMVLDLPPLWVP